MQNSLKQVELVAQGGQTEGDNLFKMIELKFLKRQCLSANEQVERDFITGVARHSRLAVPLAGGGTGAVDPKAAGLGGHAGTGPHRRVDPFRAAIARAFVAKAVYHLYPAWATDTVNLAVAKGLPRP